MMKRLLLVAWVAAAAMGLAAETTPPHPRIFADAQRFEEVRGFCSSDPLGHAYAERIVFLADRVLDRPPVERIVTGRRLLGVSRTAVGRILNLGFAWRYTGERKYLERGIVELEAICAFSDWHPEHYLDVGEMALAAAVGYDWFYDGLTEAQRKAMSEAIAARALQPWRDGGKHLWWEKSGSNWNAVCNAGTMAACWALWDDPGQQAFAREIFARSRQSIVSGLGCYAPRGAYLEGPMYWGYGTAFACLAVELVKEITGDDAELAAATGFAQTCEYLDAVTSPSGSFFEFGDGVLRRGLEFPSFWLARRFNRPDTLVRHERRLLAAEAAQRNDKSDNEGGRLNALIALWLDGGIPDKVGKATANCWFGGHTDAPTCTLSLPNGTWVGIKGGKAKAAHMHMDAGFFVYEAAGRRFVIDYGMEPYHGVESRGINLWDGSQKGQRWNCFRLGPEAHAIARVNGEPLLVEGLARFVAFETNALPYRITLDTSACYRKGISATRTYELAADGTLVVRDAFAGLAAGDRVTAQLPLKRGSYRLAGEELRGDAKQLTIATAGGEVKITPQEPRVEKWMKPIEPSDRLDLTAAADAAGKVTLTCRLIPPAQR